MRTSDPITVELNTDYEVRARIYCEDSSDIGKVEIFDGTTSLDDITTESSGIWEQVEVPFTTSGDCTQITIKLAATSVSSGVYFDYVKIFTTVDNSGDFSVSNYDTDPTTTTDSPLTRTQMAIMSLTAQRTPTRTEK